MFLNLKIILAFLLIIVSGNEACRNSKSAPSEEPVITDETTTEVADKEVPEEEQIYSYDEAAKHYLAVVFPVKEGNVNERLASLVVSLEAMMDRQSSLERTVKERRDKKKKATSERKEALRKLLELDDDSEEEDSSLESRFKKQTKEMEAIAAVINAARD